MLSDTTLISCSSDLVEEENPSLLKGQEGEETDDLSINQQIDQVDLGSYATTTSQV